MSKKDMKNDVKESQNNEEKSESSIIRDIFSLGLGTVFLTEKMIRDRVSKMSLPKDAIKFMSEQSKKSREQFSKIISKEISKFLERINVSEEINKILSRYKYKISIELELIEKDKE